MPGTLPNTFQDQLLSPVSQWREQSAAQGPARQVPTVVRNGSGMWTRAGSPASESVPSSLPCYLYRDRHSTHFRHKAVCFILSPPPSPHEGEAPASARKLAAEAPVLCQAGEGLLGFLDPLSSWKETSCYRDEGHLRGFSHSSKC